MVEVAMTPLFSAIGGFGDNMGLIVMIVLYSLILIAVWLNRLEGATQGAELILPSGQRLQVSAQLPGQDTDKGNAADDGQARRLFGENVWDWGLQELRWWQQVGAFIVLVSLAYGVGIIIFGMLYPASRSTNSFAPYAFLNGILMMLVLVVGSPSRPKERHGDERDDAERFAAAFSSMRYIEPARQQEWTPSLLPAPGLALSFHRDEKLAYQLVHSQREEQTPQLHIGALFTTLFLSTLIAPLLSGLVIGGLVLLKFLPSIWLLPLFAWTSGGLTLIFAVGSFLFLQRHAQIPDHTAENSEIVFDFEERNLYAKQGEALGSYHFAQCSALLLDATTVSAPAKAPEKQSERRAPEATASASTDEGEMGDEPVKPVEDADASQDKEPEEAGMAEENDADPSEVRAFQVYVYGAALPADGLLLASFVPADDIGEGEAHETSLGFAAMLAKGMRLPLFASHEFPS